MRARLILVSIACVLPLTIATQASAHVSLVKATPAVNASGAAPSTIKLQFSGKLEPKFSGIDVLNAKGDKLPVTAGPAAADGRSISAKVGQRLAPGAYKVAWRIVSTDGHRMTGGYNFTVR